MRRHKLNAHVIEDRAEAAGVIYQEGEPLRAGKKEEERDRHRWELDPASAEDYGDRTREGHPPKRKMKHRDQYE